MELYLIRHGAAVPREGQSADATRPLTQDGRRRMRKIARGLDLLGVRFDRLYHSPWLRAVESAEELSTLVDGELTVAARLAEAPSDGLLEMVEGERVALVGHRPYLGQLLGLLVFGRESEGSRFLIKKGGVVWLSGSLRAAGMGVVAMYPPRALSSI